MGLTIVATPRTRRTKEPKVPKFNWIAIAIVVMLIASGQAARAANPPTAVPCKGEDLQAAEGARAEARRALNDVLRGFDADDKRLDALLVKWFGAVDPSVRKQVEAVLTQSLGWVNASAFYCHYNNDGSEVLEIVDPTGDVILVDGADGLYAYVDKNDISKLYLGLAFFESRSSGYNSRLGTVIHELTHYALTGNTDDQGYGRERSLELAKQRSPNALKNADSFQFFVEEWLTG